MANAIIILHILVCIALIFIVLLQHGKGAGIGAAFGGASQTFFGSAGATPFLAKLTAVVAVLFMLTSLTLTFMSRQQEFSVMRGVKGVPVTQPKAPTPPPGQPATPGGPAAPAQ